MNKVGIFLASGVNSGGSFQYNLIILDALNLGSAEVVCAYTNSKWHKYLGKFYSNFKIIDLSKCSRGEVVWNFFVRLIMSIFPLDLRRKWMKYFDSQMVKMRKANVDVWLFPSQDQLSFEFGLPALTSIHDLMHRYERRFSEITEAEFNRREYLYNNICRYSTGILVDSLVGKQQLLDSYSAADEKRIYVLPYVAPGYIFYRSKGFAKRFSLPKKYILYPAQFWSHKNHINLLKAFKLSLNICPDLNLVLCGCKNNNYLKVLSLIRELGLKNKVKILGYVKNDDLVRLYRKATALIMPTFFGPTNIPPLEAMTVGCPVAVSDIYGAREQLGDAALYFDPNKIEDIASKIVILYKNSKLRLRLIKKGLLKTKTWGIKQFSEKLFEIIEKLD